MTRIQEMVLKIHSRCNLACDHCYMYELADQSWKTRPTVISEETVTQVARRLSAYAADHRLESVAVILHGGEPLLVGPARLRRICGEITRILSPVTTVDFHMHTNGLLLHERNLEVLGEFGVRVGVSLDGGKSANDRHRLDKRGRSSHEKVLQGIGRLQASEYASLFQGILCTVDIANDPIAVHDALADLRPPRIDYLLPHSTWDNPPPAGGSGSPTPYADWLLGAFDRWLEQGRPMEVRTFDSVLSTLRGGPSLTEAMGLAPSDLAVVETDGSIEQVDSLKAAYAGAPDTGFDVFQHTFDDFARHPGVRARQSGIDGVSESCRRCPVVDSCGGGLYTHRYSTERGFDNPSVYCADLRGFIEGVAERITERTLSPAVSDAEELRLAQIELTRDLLRRSNDRAAGDADWARAWETLLLVDGSTSTAPELDVLLAHPFVRSALRRTWSERLPSRWLAALAVAAAVRGRAEVSLAWDQPTPLLHLPTLGTLRLPAPGRVEVTTRPDGFSVRHTEAVRHVRADEDADGTWLPLRSTKGGLLIDDLDPSRHCFTSANHDALDSMVRDRFEQHVDLAFELADKEKPDWRCDPHVLTPWVVSPLANGTGVRLGEHAPGALGVAIDAEPDFIAEHLYSLSRRARFVALREITDLAVPGRPTARLLQEADEAVTSAIRASGRVSDEGSRDVAVKGAHHALMALTDEPERDLTETGAMFVAQLWSDWHRLSE